MAIVKAAADRKIGVVPAADFKAIADRGAQGTVNGEAIVSGIVLSNYLAIGGG